MPRIRGMQNGQLYLSKRKPQFWSGRFYVHENHHGKHVVVRRLVRLGWLRSLTHEQAIDKLRSLALEEQAKYDSLKFIGLTAVGPLQQLRSRQKGIISELLVAMDLTRKGFEVFRHVSDLAPCDMVALKNDLIWRVEVKYVGTCKSGDQSYHFARYISRSGKFDVLAVVSPDESIHYIKATGEKLERDWSVTDHSNYTEDEAVS